MKRIIVFLCILLICTLPVNAADGNYDKQYQSIDGDKLSEGLSDEVKQLLESNGIDPSGYDWVNSLTSKNVILHIWKFVTGGIKKPIATGAVLIGVILITAALTAFGDIGRFRTALYAATFAISAIIAIDIWDSVSAAVGAVKGVSAFMLSFVPAFAGVVALSGKAVTAASMSALLLAASEAVAYISSYAILPLMGGYLSISISTGVSPLLENSGIAEGIKKVSSWFMTLISTLFIGVLSIQTVVNSAADGLTLKTAKFILGTSVPIVGGALSEAVSTDSASMGLLKSSIGIYGVVALAVILLPIILEIIIWRAVLLLASMASSTFCLPKISGILKAVDSMMALLLGIVLFVGGLFIISLTVVVTAGKT